jgi:hypothetical protein
MSASKILALTSLFLARSGQELREGGIPIGR